MCTELTDKTKFTRVRLLVSQGNGSEEKGFEAGENGLQRRVERTDSGDMTDRNRELIPALLRELRHSDEYWTWCVEGW